MKLSNLTTIKENHGTSIKKYIVALDRDFNSCKKVITAPSHRVACKIYVRDSILSKESIKKIGLTVREIEYSFFS